MKKNKKVVVKRSLKTRILSYRCKGKGIVNGEQAVIEQISIGHKYQNALVANERDRRKAIETARDELYPKLPELRTAIDSLVKQRVELRTSIKATNAQERRKVKPDKDTTKQIKVLSDQIKELCIQEKALRTKANQDQAVLAAWEQVEVKHNISVEGNGLRSQFSSMGLTPSNYRQIERQVPRKCSGNLPKFQRWTGEGKVVVMVGQKGEKAANGKKYGLTHESIALGKSKDIQLSKKTLTSKDGKVSYSVDVCHIRLTKDTVVEIHFTLDRPIEGEIREVCLVRRKISTHWHYLLQFVVAKAEEWEKPWPQAESGMVGIDVGYRLVNDGLRVACWKGTDGNKGEIIIPNKRISRTKKVEDLQSIRADNFNAIKVMLGEWLATKPTMPEWLTERTKTLPHWTASSQARLASILLHWRNNRFEGDAIYESLEKWRQQDKHLYTWQEFQRKSDQNWREWFYRRELQTLAMKYRYCVLEAKLPSFQKVAPEKETETDKVQKRYRNLASMGRLHQLAIETFAIGIKVDPAYTTMHCHKCKKLCEFDKAELIHTCEHCSATWDQDENASDNLLEDGQLLDLLKLHKRKDGAWEKDDETTPCTGS